MRVLLIGSNGYLGSNLQLFFRRHGIELECFDRHVGEGQPTAGYQPLDITDADAMLNVDWHADAVIFLAGLTGTKASNENPSLYTTVNVRGLENALVAIRRSKADPLFIFPSTRLVYRGRSAALSEESEKECKTVYALNKLCCESLLGIFATHYSLRYACFRICVPYGNIADVAYSYGTLGFLLKQASQGEIVLYGDGLQRRTFTHVGDIAAIMHAAVMSRKLRSDVYNIGGEDFSLRSVAELIARRKRCTIRSVPWPEDDLLLESGDTVFDDAKLRRDLGYTYRHRLEQWLDTLP